MARAAGSRPGLGRAMGSILLGSSCGNDLQQRAGRLQLDFQAALAAMLVQGSGSPACSSVQFWGSYYGCLCDSTALFDRWIITFLLYHWHEKGSCV